MQLRATLARIYWFIFRPTTQGAKIAIIHDGKTLMVRHTYGNTDLWRFPGGKIEKGEKPEDAARREIREELGIELKNLVYLDSFLNTREYKRDTVHCFKSEPKSLDLKLQTSEIKDARWFELANVPKEGSLVTRHILSFLART